MLGRRDPIWGSGKQEALPRQGADARRIHIALQLHDGASVVTASIAYAGGMLHVNGAPVSSDDAEWIVARLYADAHADAVGAASIIETGIDRELYAVALTPAHRDAILRHLEDCPEGLVELRGTLLSDNRDRMTSRRHRSDPATVIATTSTSSGGKVMTSA